MALNIAEIINAVHGVHCHQCYDLIISYHQCHKVTKSLNRYPCICLYLCVCACFCLLSSPLINCWKKSQLCGIPLKCFHGSDYSWTSWSTVNVTNRVSWSAKKHHFDIYLTKPPNAEEEAAMALLVLGRFVLLQLDLKKKLRYRRISSWFAKTLYCAQCFLIQIVVPFYTIILF